MEELAMGMCACYQWADKEQIDSLIDSDDYFDAIEEMQEEDDDGVCDIDKLWDGLHYLLTKKTEPDGNDIISIAIFGEHIISSEDMISYILPERTAEIAETLGKIDFEAALKTYSGKDFSAKEIYPDIWDEDPMDIKDELREAFGELRVFYAAAASCGKGVIVSIY